MKVSPVSVIQETPPRGFLCDRTVSPCPTAGSGSAARGTPMTSVPLPLFADSLATQVSSSARIP